MDDDAILKKFAGAYVTKETLNRLIESSLDEEHFRSKSSKNLLGWTFSWATAGPDAATVSR